MKRKLIGFTSGALWVAVASGCGASAEQPSQHTEAESHDESPNAAAEEPTDSPESSASSIDEPNATAETASGPNGAAPVEMVPAQPPTVVPSQETQEAPQPEDELPEDELPEDELPMTAPSAPSGEGTEQTQASAEDGPCGAVQRFVLELDIDIELCMPIPPLSGALPGNVTLSCAGAPCRQPFRPSDYTRVPPSGMSWDWDGQVIEEGDIACTDSIPGTCTTGPSTVSCAFDAEGFSRYAQLDEQGQPTMYFSASLVSPLGTCTNDPLGLAVPVGPDAGSIVTVKASDFVLPEPPEQVDCGEASCAGASQYCEFTDSGSDPVNRVGRCVDYPQQCLDNHTCECLADELVGAESCVDRGMRGVASVFLVE